MIALVALTTRFSRAGLKLSNTVCHGGAKEVSRKKDQGTAYVFGKIYNLDISFVYHIK